MKMLIIGILLIIQILNTPVQCEELVPPAGAVAGDSTGRSILSAGFWFLIQQALLISLIVLATVYAVYVLIIPFAFGQINAKRSLNDRISSVSDFVFKSIDPVDLTFGVMNISEEQCRLRAICQLRKAVSTMPLLQLMYDSYFPASVNMDKYQEAIDAGESLEDCYRLFENCENDPYEKLPAIF